MKVVCSRSSQDIRFNFHLKRIEFLQFSLVELCRMHTNACKTTGSAKCKFRAFGFSPPNADLNDSAHLRGFQIPPLLHQRVYWAWSANRDVECAHRVHIAWGKFQKHKSTLPNSFPAIAIEISWWKWYLPLSFSGFRLCRWRKVMYKKLALFRRNLWWSCSDFGVSLFAAGVEVRDIELFLKCHVLQSKCVFKEFAATLKFETPPKTS